jgi:hypothetical protein
MNMTADVNVTCEILCASFISMPTRKMTFEASIGWGDIIEQDENGLKHLLASEIWSQDKEAATYPRRSVICTDFKVLGNREIWK